jgi:plastocyanin
MLHWIRAWSALLVVFGLMAVGASALASCGGGASNSSKQPASANSAPTAGPTPTPAPVTIVTIADNSFTPASVTVKAGTVVRWVWTGSNAHSVLVGGLNSGQHTGSGSFEQTFPSAGAIIQYQCGVHGAAMAGTIIVN